MGGGGGAFNNFLTAKGGTIFICNYYQFFLGGGGSFDTLYFSENPVPPPTQPWTQWTIGPLDGRDKPLALVLAAIVMDWLLSQSPEGMVFPKQI